MEVGQRFNASKGDGPEGSSSPDTIKHSSHSLLSATFNDAVELFTVKVSLNSNTNTFPNNSKDSLQEQENGRLMPIFPASLGHWGLSCLGLFFFPPSFDHRNSWPLVPSFPLNTVHFHGTLPLVVLLDTSFTTGKLRFWKKQRSMRTSGYGDMLPVTKAFLVCGASHQVSPGGASWKHFEDVTVPH